MGVSLARFPQNLQGLSSLQGALAVKISLDLLKGLWSHGGFKFVIPKFAVPPSGKTMCQTPKF